MENFILPSEIPWQKIKGRDLEELLYWLFDSIGAKQLEWRVGGTGQGAPDQGRDLELVLHVPTQDIEITKQKWWVEAKGRTATVEPDEVKSAVWNTGMRDDLDVLVIATNTHFSNPTRDWVKDWQRIHPTPEIRLWDRIELERLCSQNPLPIVRLFYGALSPQGKLEVVSNRLWNYATFSDAPVLEDVWCHRDEVQIDSRGLIALVTSEFAHGSIIDRSWPTTVSDDLLGDSLQLGISNLYHLVFRADERGEGQESLIEAMAYLVAVSAQQLGSALTSSILDNAWHKDQIHSTFIKDTTLEVVLARLRGEFIDSCTSDCDRFEYRQATTLGINEIETYWHRLIERRPPHEDEESTLVIESLNVPCKVGFDLTSNKSCPLCRINKPHNEIGRFLFVIQEVAKFRTPTN